MHIFKILMLMRQNCNLQHPFKWASTMYFLLVSGVNFKLQKLVLFLTRTNYSKKKKLTKKCFRKHTYKYLGFLSENEHHLIKEALLLEVPEHIQGSPNLNPSWTYAYLTTCHCLTYSSKNNLELALAPNTQALVFQPRPTIAARHFNPKLSANLSVVCEIEAHCYLLFALLRAKPQKNKSQSAQSTQRCNLGSSPAFIS